MVGWPPTPRPAWSLLAGITVLPTTMELLPTSRPLGIRPWMAASWERKQLGWQPAHSARAVSREAGQAGLRPPAPEQGPGQATGMGPSSSSHQRFKGALSTPALSKEQGHELAGSPFIQLSFSQTTTVVGSSTWSRRFSSQIIIKTATTTADIEQALAPHRVPLHRLLWEGGCHYYQTQQLSSERGNNSPTATQHAAKRLETGTCASALTLHWLKQP